MPLSDWDLGTQVGEATQNFNLYNRGTSSIALSVEKGTNNVGIGTVGALDAKLVVRGLIHAQEIKVDLSGSVTPDYVFENDYKLISLDEIKAYIDQNKHLPEVPSAKEIEKNGLQLGEMNLLLLRKIEELTLYAIEMNKTIRELKGENETQNKLIEELAKKN